MSYSGMIVSIHHECLYIYYYFPIREPNNDEIHEAWPSGTVPTFMIYELCANNFKQHLNQTKPVILKSHKKGHMQTLSGRMTVDASGYYSYKLQSVELSVFENFEDLLFIIKGDFGEPEYHWEPVEPEYHPTAFEISFKASRNKILELTSNYDIRDELSNAIKAQRH